MPHIVQDTDGIQFYDHFFLGQSTLNYGVTSDVAQTLTASVYINGGAIFNYGGMIADNFYINQGLQLPIQLVTTQTGGVSIVTDLVDHIIIASFSIANSNTIWLGTASRVDGKELIIRRVDGTTASVTIRSSQIDIDDANVGTGTVNSLTLNNTSCIRIVRSKNNAGTPLWIVRGYL